MLKFRVVCWTLLTWIRLAAMAERPLPSVLDDPIIGSEKGAIHVVTSTECFKSYFVYQSLTLKYTFDKVRQPGKLTRVLSCNEEQARDHLSDEDLAIMDTLVVPNWTRHPITGDYYQAYNRPVSLMFWLAERKPTAEWTLIVDPDMMFRQPFTVEQFWVPEGFALTAHYNYLIGGRNALAERHIPEVPLKNDNFGGVRQRRADESGAFMFMRTRDLIKVAPLWLSYTEAVRQDPDAWNLTGDTNLKKGEKPWISEMYGYVYAMAKVGIRNKIEPTVQYYPKYPVRDVPILIHYGLVESLGEYVFSKHQHFDFEALKCPPWNMSTSRGVEQDYGLFPHPPPPSTLTEMDGRKLFGDLMVIETVNTINKALCQRHRQKCIGMEAAVEQECQMVDQIEKEVTEAYVPLNLPGVLCHDDHAYCSYWRGRNECENTWMYMVENCRASCERCRPVYKPPSPTVMTEAVERLRCVHLAMEEIVEDVECRKFIEDGSIRAEDLGAHPLHFMRHPSDVPAPFLVRYCVGLVFVGVLFCVLIKFNRQRRKRPKALL